MKNIYLSLVTLAISMSANAQWTTSGTNAYYSNTGNVGIGNTGPISKLQVGSGTTNTGSTVAMFGTNASGQAVNALSLVNSAGGSANNAVSLSFHTAGDYSPTAKISAIAQATLPVTDLAFYSYGSVLTERMRILGNGNVGIGLPNPGTKLNVNGVISMDAFAYMSCLRLPSNGYTNLFLGGALKDNGDGTYTVRGDGGSNYFGAIRMDNGNTNQGAINFYGGATVGGSDYTVSNATLNSNYLQMRIAGGNVSIGTDDSRGYKLAVNGSAIATSMKVKPNGSWPDFVFLKEYKLPALTEVKAYIDKNQHLPDMPSAAEVRKDGLDLGEMNRLLLKKVEELTLYLIDAENENKLLKEKLSNVDQRLENLEKNQPASTATH